MWGVRRCVHSLCVIKPLGGLQEGLGDLGVSTREPGLSGPVCADQEDAIGLQRQKRDLRRTARCGPRRQAVGVILQEPRSRLQRPELVAIFLRGEAERPPGCARGDVGAVGSDPGCGEDAAILDPACYRATRVDRAPP